MGQRNPRSRDEIKSAIEVQRKAIAASAKSYDEGNGWEALRLSTAVYNLVHDHGSIRSLLTQIGIRGALRFFASGGKHNSNNLLRETRLVKLRFSSDGTAEYLPILDDSPRVPQLVQFHEWWEKDLILADGAQFQLTRKRLVFTLRNQEGGGHFSAEMNDPSYLRFSRDELTAPYVQAPGKPPKVIMGVELATMRQIAWELEKSLDNFGEIK